MFVSLFIPQIAVIIVLHAHGSECKVTRTSHAVKKASSVQLKVPKKGQKSILDAFKGLPTEDIEFLKQLDKQFKQFGDNVKIKVQRDNRTASKNTKRTIEGSLG